MKVIQDLRLEEARPGVYYIQIRRVAIESGEVGEWERVTTDNEEMVFRENCIDTVKKKWWKF